MQHLSVLLPEAVDALVTDADGIYVDGTFGRGGHARAILARLSPNGPPGRARPRPGSRRERRATMPALAADPRFTIEHTAFSAMAATLAALGITQVSGVLLDLGVSSPQIDDPERGFCFRFDGPLDMRMDPTRGESAAELLARADERDIAEVIRDYGEERFAVQVAKALVARARERAPCSNHSRACRRRGWCGQDPRGGPGPGNAHVSGSSDFRQPELEELEQALSAALALLAPGGRLVVISFHSLEDRIVKTFIAAARAGASSIAALPFAPPTAAAAAARARRASSRRRREVGAQSARALGA